MSNPLRLLIKRHLFSTSHLPIFLGCLANALGPLFEGTRPTYPGRYKLGEISQPIAVGTQETLCLEVFPF